MLQFSRAVVLVLLTAHVGSAAAQGGREEAPAATSPSTTPAPCGPGDACAKPNAPATETPFARPALPVVVAGPPHPALLARVEALRAERAAIRIGTPIGLLAGGLGVLLAGASLGVQTLLYSDAVGLCGFGGCLSPLAGRALGATSAVLGVAGIALISVGGPMLRTRLRARRALGEELRQAMREAQLAFDLRPAQAGLTLRAKF